MIPNLIDDDNLIKFFKSFGTFGTPTNLTSSRLEDGSGQLNFTEPQLAARHQSARCWRWSKLYGAAQMGKTWDFLLEMKAKKRWRVFWGKIWREQNLKLVFDFVFTEKYLVPFGSSFWQEFFSMKMARVKCLDGLLRTRKGLSLFFLCVEIELRIGNDKV